METVRKKLEKEINETFYENVEEDLDVLKLNKLLYRTCMDLDSIKLRDLAPLQSMIDDLGGWPVVKGDLWDESSISWQNVLETAWKKGLVTNFPFTITTIPNYPTNSSEMILRVNCISLK